MPLLKKAPFVRAPAPRDMKPDDEVFYCESTGEVFKSYEDFFERTILCNSLVWSCAVTGKSGLTFEEAVDAERRARKRLGTLPRPLKKALLWLTHKTRRGRLSDLVDDVYVFAFNRFFQGELIEAIVQGQWHDCKIEAVLQPTEEELKRDLEEDSEDERKAKEEEERELQKRKDKGEDVSKIKPKEAKKEKYFRPPDHLFKYKVVKIEPVENEVDEVYTVTIDCIKREKGTYTREKNLLFLKNVVEMGKDGNFALKKGAVDKYKVDTMAFDDIFAGPEPKFEESKRLKGLPSASSSSRSKKSSPDSKKSKSSKDKRDKSSSSSGKKGSKANQGTLDGWMKGGKSQSTSALPGVSKAKSGSKKKQSAAEIEAEMKRIQEQNKRFKEDMARRAEEARKKKLEEKVREKERKKEEAKLLKEVLNEWKKPREDLLCDDLLELPKPTPVHCKIPNPLFGDFLTLLEFIHDFDELLETKDSFPQGVTFETMETALTDQETIGGSLYDILSFLLGALFDLQDEEDEEVKVDKLTANADNLDKNVLGKDADVANQIKSATVMAQWPMKTQGGQKLRELHMDQWSLTEVLRLHLQAAGAFRSEKLIMWLYQQRGGYRLADDPGLHFRMEEPQILEALNTKTVYEMSIGDKMKILNCLMHQILSFATVRDEVDDKYNEYYEARSDLRNHIISENRRKRQLEDAEKEKRKEERAQKKEEDLKVQEKTKAPGTENEPVEDKEKEAAAPPAKKKEEPLPIEAHLTERQRLAIVSKREAEERERQKEADGLKANACLVEKQIQNQVSDMAASAGMVLLGRDRAYRRYWLLETLPGLFVEQDDDLVGPCMDRPTPLSKNSGPIDEETALQRVREIMSGQGKLPGDEKASSDKENDQEETRNKTGGDKPYIKKAVVPTVLKQKVLATKNGSLDVTTSTTSAAASTSEEGSVTAPSNSVSDEAAATNVAGVSIKEEEIKVELPWGACLADNETCHVHSAILPRTYWSYFSTIDQIDELVEKLNGRGFREMELKEKIIAERERIAKNLKKFNHDSILNCEDEMTKEEANGKTNIAEVVDLTLRDQIMELEEKIFFGTLGTLKIRSRTEWQDAIQAGGYDKQCDSLTWGGKSMADTPFESRLASAAESRECSPERAMDVDGEEKETGANKRDSTGSNTARKLNRKVRDLACAILQVSHMLDGKYLKAPLGEEEKDKKKRLKEEEKRKRDRDALEEDQKETSDKASDHIQTPFERWEDALMKSTSCAQLNIHLTTLDNSIIWSKSLLNAKCRLCRRKNDPENMLLCDGCDRGHHMYCLKPKLKSVPEGNWYCSDCKPKERVRSPKKKTRRVFSSAEESENEEDTSGTEDEKGEEGREEQDDEEEEESDQSEDDDELPLNKAKAKAKAKKKKTSTYPLQVPAKKTKKPLISQLFGKRRCATEANEKIARVTQHEKHDIHSGNSSGAESAVEPTPTASNRSTRACRVKRSLEPHPTTSPPANGGSAAKQQQQQRGGKRRNALDEDLLVMFNPTGLEDLLNAMMKHKDGWPFDRPITKADAPDYHKIIKRPIDLGTIRSSLNRMKYSCNQEVLDDINTVFANCRTYNKEDAEEYQCGVRLEKYFRKEAKKNGLLGIEQDEETELCERPSKKARRTF